MVNCSQANDRLAATGYLASADSRPEHHEFFDIAGNPFFESCGFWVSRAALVEFKIGIAGSGLLMQGFRL